MFYQIRLLHKKPLNLFIYKADNKQSNFVLKYISLDKKSVTLTVLCDEKIISRGVGKYFGGFAY
jgi:hypothetical protein